MTKPICKVEDCNEPAHAKGYCRKHYAKMWREKGRKESDKGTAKQSKKAKRAINERYRALLFELKNARKMYDSVVGISTRIRWKKRMRWLQQELMSLDAGSDDIEL